MPDSVSPVRLPKDLMGPDGTPRRPRPVRESKAGLEPIECRLRTLVPDGQDRCLGAVMPRDPPEAIDVIPRRLSGRASLHLNQHDLEQAAALQAGVGLAVVLPNRDQVDDALFGLSTAAPDNIEPQDLAMART